MQNISVVLNEDKTIDLPYGESFHTDSSILPRGPNITIPVFDTDNNRYTLVFLTNETVMKMQILHSGSQYDTSFGFGRFNKEYIVVKTNWEGYYKKVVINEEINYRLSEVYNRLFKHLFLFRLNKYEINVESKEKILNDIFHTIKFLYEFIDSKLNNYEDLNKLEMELLLS